MRMKTLDSTGGAKMVEAKAPRRPNPFDYVGEVTSQEQFAGRAAELDTIRAELSRLSADPPISPILALIGERRVGKTSLLHRVSEVAANQSLVCAKVTLTTATTSSPWEFWAEVMRSLVTAAVASGAFELSIPPEHIGFRTPSDANSSKVDNPPPSLRFFSEYADQDTKAIAPLTSTLISDLRALCGAVCDSGCSGVVLLVDEAHLLIEQNDVKQQLRLAIQAVDRCGIVFAGEPELSRLFTHKVEPFYLQAVVVPVEDFVSVGDVSDCALLPLTEDERQLMSPMTIDNIGRLSRGKPNQIRLLCNSIYRRFESGGRDDLNITIDTLDDVLDSIETTYGTETALKSQVDAIKRLNSVDLESIYQMTRFPDWSIDDVIQLDECFKGEARSDASMTRRRHVLERKKGRFIAAGLMKDEHNRCVLDGDEFLYLYLRFWYEVRKFGDLTQRLVLGKGTPTPFGEKAEKLVRSFTWEIRRTPSLVYLTMSKHDTGTDDCIASVRRRFSVLTEIRDSQHFKVKGSENEIDELFALSELVKKSGVHHLLIFSVRNLENPRESAQIEAYIDSGDQPIVILSDVIQLVRQQAEDAKVWLEAFDHFAVDLLTLPDLLTAVGGPTMEEWGSNLGVVGRWRIASVRRLLDRDEPDVERDEGLSAEGDDADWLDLYDKGHPEAAEVAVENKLGRSSSRTIIARLHNDRGYIRLSLEKTEQAKSDLQRAVDLHYLNLPLTLLNQSVVAIDDGEYEKAIEAIDDALFLTVDRRSVVAGYLRVRVLGTHLPVAAVEKFEQHPASVLEVAYINLAFALYKSANSDAASSALEEGLALIPSSFRMKHALARLHLADKRAPVADEIYAELAGSSIDDQMIDNEVRMYSRLYLKKSRRPSRS